MKRSILKSNVCLWQLVLLGILLCIVSCRGKDTLQQKQKQQDKTIKKIDVLLQSKLKHFANQSRVKGNFAFFVYDLTADQPVCGYQENLPLPSASCLKLLSGVAGLHLLGTNYTYITSIYKKGMLANGVLKGDLTFKGSLDPLFTEKEVIHFAKVLKRKGIQRITGKIIIDLVIHDPVKSEEHWYPWDLSFSKYGLFYKGSNRIMKSIKYAWRNQGIAVADSQFVFGTLPAKSVPVYSYGQPIHRIINRMWKHSSNTQSTALLYTIGHRINTQAYPPTTGVAYLRRFMREELALADTNLVVHDGCGLCTHNRLTPNALTQILIYGYQHPSIYDVLMQNLSISGTDGTLKDQMTNPCTRGKIHAKTGTLSHPYGISSLAGYCQASNGHHLAFAIMNTEMSVLDARVLQRKLCEILVDNNKKKHFK